MICYSRKRSFPSKSWEIQQCRCRTDWPGINSQSNGAEFRHWSVNSEVAFESCTGNTCYDESLQNNNHCTIWGAGELSTPPLLVAFFFFFLQGKQQIVFEKSSKICWCVCLSGGTADVQHRWTVMLTQLSLWHWTSTGTKAGHPLTEPPVSSPVCDMSKCCPLQRACLFFIVGIKL